jgi:hypothetical protein
VIDRALGSVGRLLRPAKASYKAKFRPALGAHPIAVRRYRYSINILPPYLELDFKPELRLE